MLSSRITSQEILQEILRQPSTRSGLAIHPSYWQPVSLTAHLQQLEAQQLASSRPSLHDLEDEGDMRLIEEQVLKRQWPWAKEKRKGRMRLPDAEVEAATCPGDPDSPRDRGREHDGTAMTQNHEVERLAASLKR